MQQTHSHVADHFDAIEFGARVNLVQVNGPQPAPPTPALPAPPNDGPKPPKPDPAPAPAPKPDPGAGTGGPDHGNAGHEELSPPPLEDSKDEHARIARETNPHPETVTEPTIAEGFAAIQSRLDAMSVDPNVNPEIKKMIDDADAKNRQMTDFYLGS